MNTRPESEPRDRTEEFVRLLGQTERHRYAYLMSLLNDANLADEIGQETNLVLWREFDRFESGTNFTAWSCRVAFNQVRAWRKRQQRSRLQFSDEFLEAVADELERQTGDPQERFDALRSCVAALPEHHRELVQHRYTNGDSIESIAGRTNRTADSVYRMLSRVRCALRDCVSSKLMAGEH